MFMTSAPGMLILKPAIRFLQSVDIDQPFLVQNGLKSSLNLDFDVKYKIFLLFYWFLLLLFSANTIPIPPPFYDTIGFAANLTCVGVCNTWEMLVQHGTKQAVKDNTTLLPARKLLISRLPIPWQSQFYQERSYLYINAMYCHGPFCTYSTKDLGSLISCWLVISNSSIFISLFQSLHDRNIEPHESVVSYFLSLFSSASYSRHSSGSFPQA